MEIDPHIAYIKDKILTDFVLTSSAILGELVYPNQILEGSEYFGTSIFRFSILELVEIDAHIAYIVETIFGRFCTDFVSHFGVVSVPYSTFRRL